jgi:aminoglycoside phosphotransferase (APT) family kinase protein
LKQDISTAFVRHTQRLVPATIKNVLARLTRGTGLSQVRPSDALLHMSLATSVIDDLSRRLGTPCELIDVHSTRTGSLTVRIRADRFYVAKLPLQASTEPRLRQNAQALNALGQVRWATPFLSTRCPALVLLGTASGHFYSVESGLPGRDGASLLRARGCADELILSAEHFLVKLQKASLKISREGPPQWEAHFEAAAERVARLAKRAGGVHDYHQLVSDIRKRLAEHQIPSVYSHGNFWPGNVLFDTANTLTGVIDWDCTTEFALPAIDLIYFLVRTHSLMGGVSFGEALADWIDAEPLPFLDDCITRHCHELSISTQLIVPLSYCSWIQHLDAHCLFGTSASTDPRWLDRNVRQVLDRWRLRNRVGRLWAGRWNTSAVTS